jgi:hypothetical protein
MQLRATRKRPNLAIAAAALATAMAAGCSDGVDLSGVAGQLAQPTKAPDKQTSNDVTVLPDPAPKAQGNETLDTNPEEKIETSAAPTPAPSAVPTPRPYEIKVLTFKTQEKRKVTFQLILDDSDSVKPIAMNVADGIGKLVTGLKAAKIDYTFRILPMSMILSQLVDVPTPAVKAPEGLIGAGAPSYDRGAHNAIYGNAIVITQDDPTDNLRDRLLQQINAPAVHFDNELGICTAIDAANWSLLTPYDHPRISSSGIEHFLFVSDEDNTRSWQEYNPANGLPIGTQKPIVCDRLLEGVDNCTTQKYNAWNEWDEYVYDYDTQTPSTTTYRYNVEYNKTTRGVCQQYFGSTNASEPVKRLGRTNRCHIAKYNCTDPAADTYTCSAAPADGSPASTYTNQSTNYTGQYYCRQATTFSCQVFSDGQTYSQTGLSRGDALAKINQGFTCTPSGDASTWPWVNVGGNNNAPGQTGCVAYACNTIANTKVNVYDGDSARVTGNPGSCTANGQNKYVGSYGSANFSNGHQANGKNYADVSNFGAQCPNLYDVQTASPNPDYFTWSYVCANRLPGSIPGDITVVDDVPSADSTVHHNPELVTNPNSAMTLHQIAVRLGVADADIIHVDDLGPDTPPPATTHVHYVATYPKYPSAPAGSVNFVATPPQHYKKPTNDAKQPPGDSHPGDVTQTEMIDPNGFLSRKVCDATKMGVKETLINGTPDGFQQSFAHHFPKVQPVVDAIVNLNDKPCAGSAENNVKAGSDYIELANRTGGVIGDVCATDFTEYFKKLLDNVIETVQLSYDLDAKAAGVKPVGVVVMPSGRKLKDSDFTIGDDNRITLLPGAIAAGESIVVQYPGN